MTDLPAAITPAPTYAASPKQPENKYLRPVLGQPKNVTIDVYDVLEAFNVTCPGLQHAIKKMLCTGIRGQKTKSQDLVEARQALDRAIELQAHRDKNNHSY